MSNTAPNKLQHQQIQYIEFLSNDLERIKKFYNESLGWKFTDYGPEYTSFEGEYVDGGFTIGTPVKGSILIVLYSKEIETTYQKVVAAGGVIVQEIFQFPRRQALPFYRPRR